jgi:hypothetical protein
MTASGQLGQNLVRYTPVILDTWEELFKAYPGRKVSEIPFQPTAGYSGMHLSSQVTRETEIKTIKVLV